MASDPTPPTREGSSSRADLAEHLRQMIAYADRYRLGDAVDYEEWRIDLEAAQNALRSLRDPAPEPEPDARGEGGEG